MSRPFCTLRLRPEALATANSGALSAAFSAARSAAPAAARALVLALSLLAPGPSSGHDGPPYPVVVDFRSNPYLVSVWADPDVGTGTFHVYLERENSATPLPDDVRATVLVQPEDGHCPESVHSALRQADKASRLHYLAEIPFDRRGWWRVRLDLQSASGNATTGTRVEVTPPGSQGPLLDFAMFLFPFLAVGCLFILALARRRRGRAGGA